MYLGNGYKIMGLSQKIQCINEYVGDVLYSDFGKEISLTENVKLFFNLKS